MTGQPPDLRPQSGHEPARPAPTIAGLREAAAHCTACVLYRNATQTCSVRVPRGRSLCRSASSRVTLRTLRVTRLSDRCLAEAGIDRARTHITNVVKHFKWVPRGSRRIHAKPGAVDIEACFPWLEAEIAAVAPRIIIALGATAAQALFGRAFRVTKDRSRLMSSALAADVLATVHPSALLRAPDEETRERQIRRFVAIVT